ncbi:methyltransferase, TIGR04325 family [Leptospira meyeri]|uniref:methyltransferase, TIGR04325 family n=1 Tax=Leptospira meyeri TaxID=29508 RepID=UPI0014382F5E|nr:methyltransferase, TIGR04325 family [Leptospira meyeri]
MQYSPVILFVYNRPEHTKRVIEALVVNQESSKTDLFIYSDAPKTENQVEAVNQVRSYIKQLKGFNSVLIIERSENFGLAKSILDGVTEVLKKFNSVIVLEDDILVGPHFLNYMNSGLEKYKNEEKVASIHAYNYPMNTQGLEESFFIKGADCWGWATWKRVWDQFETDGTKLLKELERRNLIHEFDYEGSHLFSEMLKGQIEGKNNSWAVRWYASMFLLGKITLYPRESLIQNIGLDNSGTHCTDDDTLSRSFSVKKIECFPKYIENDLIARKKLRDYFRTLNPKKKSTSLSFSKIMRYILAKIYRTFIPIAEREHSDLFFGNFTTWTDAVKECSGYASAEILEKVKTSLLKVKNGEVTYERDSVLFNEIHYSMPLLVSLLYIASENKGKLNILDFGGSLGSSYFQNRKFLNGLSAFKWSIVEQSHFVDCGKIYFEDQNLNFYYSIDEAINANHPNAILFSSSIQYLEDPIGILNQTIEVGFDYIVFDRSPFIYGPLEERIMIQKVPEEIYKAEIPIRFLNIKKILSILSGSYELFSEFDADNEVFPEGLGIKNKCIILKRVKYGNG